MNLNTNKLLLIISLVLGIIWMILGFNWLDSTGDQHVLGWAGASFSFFVAAHLV